MVFLWPILVIFSQNCLHFFSTFFNFVQLFFNFPQLFLNLSSTFSHLFLLTKKIKLLEEHLSKLKNLKEGQKIATQSVEPSTKLIKNSPWAILNCLQNISLLWQLGLPFKMWLTYKLNSAVIMTGGFNILSSYSENSCIQSILVNLLSTLDCTLSYTLF